VFVLFCQLAQAQPSSEQLATAWAGHAQAIQDQAFHAVQLTPSDFEMMAKGEVARRRLESPGADRALGAIWSPLGRDAIWVAIQDDKDFTLIESLTEIQLGETAWGHKRLYQHLDLPWPVSDRHWVLEIKNNTVLSKSSEDRIWERVWDLTQESDIPAGRPEAIWSPVNDGGWLLLDACGGTLVVYHARSQVGGSIPQEAITRWALVTMDGLLRTTVDRAEGIHTHYVSGHGPIYRPDGSAIPTW
jgi:hypothetical protein